MKKFGIIIMIGIMMTLSACGKSDDTELDKIVHNYKETKSGSDKVDVKTSSKITIPNEAIDRVKTNNETINIILEKYNIKKGEKEYKGKINTDAKKEIIQEIVSVIDDQQYNIEDESVIIDTDITNENIIVTTPKEKLDDITDCLNEVSSLMGICQIIENKSNLWQVLITIYTYNDNGESIPYGTVGVNEEESYSVDRINVYPEKNEQDKSSDTSEEVENTNKEENTEGTTEVQDKEVSTETE